MHNWALAAFGVKEPASESSPLTIVVRRQPSQFLPAALPFSFQYAGAASGEAMKGGKYAAETKQDNDATRHTVTWTDPKTMTGRDLGCDLELRLPKKGSSVVVWYMPKKQ